ncbi:murein biosynthesis integral membrane protein MurJ [Thiobaca trueperi]|uniref:Peptidoglycan biosynthesis protein MviN/MurJ (Putative lipid II flippase) n=1 Tax=Thiobaca trueperi TaxID=127458 RepID=A0A4R3N224_9GAMM|nr:lipid II flippase MurJ [Thiobaca trueperi]TCT23120.1 peptidoglycan biosynthesis protein MviN/MurJ (putative lipid II flippase) [Thiobaca trueperi]
MNWFSSTVSRVRQSHPDHHAIAQGMAWVALFVFLGKLAGAVKEMMVAYRYGLGAEVDAYLFVLNLISWPVGIWFSVLTVVLVPLAAQIRQDAPDELSPFRSELLGLTLLLGLGLALLFGLAIWVLLQTHWTGLPPATLALATGMLPWLVALLPMGVLISLLSAWTLSAGQHVNTLLEGLPALVLVLALLTLPAGGAEPLVWGTLAGFALHLTGLAWQLARRGEIEMPRWNHRSPQWRLFWQGFGIMLAGQILMGLTGIIDQFFAAHLETGAIATLSYANRILALILGLGATAVGRATLPVFSRSLARGDDQGWRTAMHWVRFLFLLGVAMLLIGWWLAPWMVTLLFERGAFTEQDTQAVTSVLRYGLAQVPFYFAALVLVSYISSQRRYILLFYSGVIGLACKIFSNMTLVPLFGIAGIALSWTLVYAANLFFFLFFLRHR